MSKEKGKPEYQPEADQPPKKEKRQNQRAANLSEDDYIAKLCALHQTSETKIRATGRETETAQGQTGSPATSINADKLAGDPEQQQTLTIKLDYGPSKWLLDAWRDTLPGDTAGRRICRNNHLHQSFTHRKISTVCFTRRGIAANILEQ